MKGKNHVFEKKSKHPGLTLKIIKLEKACFFFIIFKKIIMWKRYAYSNFRQQNRTNELGVKLGKISVCKSQTAFEIQWSPAEGHTNIFYSRNLGKNKENYNWGCRTCKQEGKSQGYSEFRKDVENWLIGANIISVTISAKMLFPWMSWVKGRSCKNRGHAFQLGVR